MKLEIDLFSALIFGLNVLHMGLGLSGPKRRLHLDHIQNFTHAMSYFLNMNAFLDRVHWPPQVNCSFGGSVNIKTESIFSSHS